MKLDLDIKEMQTPLSIRERLVLRLLLLAIGIFVRPEYNHQWGEIVKEILDSAKDAN